MTELVIYMVPMSTQVKTTLQKWAARTDVLSDAQAIDPKLKLFAVHRWFQRGSIPGKYWGSLAVGARARGIEVSLQDIADAHECDARAST